MQASRYIPDICVIRAIQKIIWTSGCGSLELVFSPHEDITKTYKMVRIITEIIFFKKCFIILLQVDFLYTIFEDYFCFLKVTDNFILKVNIKKKRKVD